MKRELALRKDGKLTWCTAREDMKGRGRCNHLGHKNEKYFGVIASNLDMCVYKDENGNSCFNPSKTNPAFLMEHNLNSYLECKEILREEDSVIVRQPTGTGKSSIFSAMLDDYRDKNVIMIVPNNSIKEQFLSHERIKGNGNFDIITNQKLLTSFKNGSFKEDFEKYYKNTDLIMIDECHRLGAKEWGSSFDSFINEMSNENTKMIGATATDQRGDGINISEKLFGNMVVSNLNNEEAFKNGILQLPRYRAFNYDCNKRIESVMKDTEESGNIASVFNEIKNAYDIINNYNNKSNKIINNDIKNISKNGGKILIFGDTRQDFFDEDSLINRYYKDIVNNNPDIKFDKGFFDSTIRKSEFEEGFRNEKVGPGEIKVLFTVKKYDEGVHAKGVNLIVFGGKSDSTVRSLQRNGRGLDINSDNPTIVHDLVGDFTTTPIDYKRLSKDLLNGKSEERFLDMFSGIEESIQKIENKNNYLKERSSYFPFKDSYTTPEKFFSFVKDKDQKRYAIQTTRNFIEFKRTRGDYVGEAFNDNIYEEALREGFSTLDESYNYFEDRLF